MRTWQNDVEVRNANMAYGRRYGDGGDITVSNDVTPLSESQSNFVGFAEAYAPAVASPSTVWVTLDDTGINTGSVAEEWQVKVNGNIVTVASVTGAETANFILTTDVLFEAGDVITVSHVTPASGIIIFIDEPVDNGYGIYEDVTVMTTTTSEMVAPPDVVINVPTLPDDTNIDTDTNTGEN